MRPDAEKGCMIHPPESSESEEKEKEDLGFLTLCSVHKGRHLACCYFQMLDIFKNKSTNTHPNWLTLGKTFYYDANGQGTLSFLTAELYLEC